MKKLPDLSNSLHGALLGVTIGDATGWPFKDLPAARVGMVYKEKTADGRVLSRGGTMSAYNAAQAFLVTQSLCRNPQDPDAFLTDLGTSLRWCIASLFVGSDRADVAASLRLWLGKPPMESGVASSGSGPCIRAAMIGVFHRSSEVSRVSFVRASTKLTHSDIIAEVAAQAISRLAAACARGEFPVGARPLWSSIEIQLQAALGDTDGVGDKDGARWLAMVQSLESRLTEESTTRTPQDGSIDAREPSDCIIEAIPAAVVAWWSHHADPQQAISTAIRMGGRTDRVAALAGALAGAVLGGRALPKATTVRLWDWPRTPNVIQAAAYKAALSRISIFPTDGASYPLWPLPFRNLLMLCVITGHRARRLLAYAKAKAK